MNMKTILIGLLVLGMVMSTVPAMAVMDMNGDRNMTMNKGDDALRLREQTRTNQSVDDDVSIMMDEGDEAPKPQNQYDACAQNTEHETERLRPNGTGDACPKEP